MDDINTFTKLCDQVKIIFITPFEFEMYTMKKIGHFKKYKFKKNKKKMETNLYKTQISSRHPYTSYLLTSYLGQLHLRGYPQVDSPDSPRQIPAENGQVAIFVMAGLIQSDKLGT